MSDNDLQYAEGSETATPETTDWEGASIAEAPSGPPSDARWATAEDILATNDLVIKPLFIPQWNTWVNVRSMSGEERDLFEKNMIVQKGRRQEVNLANLRARLCARVLVRQDGKTPLFTYMQVEALGKKNAAALQLVFTLAQQLSGFDQQAIDELTENMGKAPSESSGSL